jgi:hypothetical protein
MERPARPASSVRSSTAERKLPHAGKDQPSMPVLPRRLDLVEVSGPAVAEVDGSYDNAMTEALWSSLNRS